MDVPADPECGVLLEALQMHLETIRSRLVSLTEHFQSRVDIPVLDTPPRGPTPTVSPSANQNVSERYSPPELDFLSSCPPPSQLRRSSSSRESTLSHPDTSSAQPKCKPLSAQLAGWQPLLACYRHVQLEALQQHVQQQLQQQRQRDSRWEAKCRTREARERRERLALKPRAYRSQLKNDTAFLQKLHTSIFYKIVEVEHKMKRQGLLRRRVDHELFWSTMLSRDRTEPVSPPPPLSYAIEEEPEELANTWAITGMHEPLPAAPLSQTHAQAAEQTLQELRRAVEANKPPKLNCLSQLVQAAPAHVAEVREVSKSALLDVRTARDNMHRMSEHAKRNESTAQEFMERPGFVDFSSVFSEFCSQLEQLPLETESDQKNVKPINMRKISLPPISRARPHEHRRPSAPKVSPVPVPAEEKTSPPERIPLSLSEVASCCTVVVRASKTTLWRNTLVSID